MPDDQQSRGWFLLAMIGGALGFAAGVVVGNLTVVEQGEVANLAVVFDALVGFLIGAIVLPTIVALSGWARRRASRRDQPQ